MGQGTAIVPPENPQPVRVLLCPLCKHWCQVFILSCICLCCLQGFCRVQSDTVTPILVNLGFTCSCGYTWQISYHSELS